MYVFILCSSAKKIQISKDAESALSSFGGYVIELRGEFEVKVRRCLSSKTSPESDTINMSYITRYLMIWPNDLFIIILKIVHIKDGLQ